MPDTLHAQDTSTEEVEQVSKFADSLPQDSALSVLLHHLVTSIHQGKDVAYITTDETVSPQQAADIAGMSRPHLLKFIRNGQLEVAPSNGTHQRIPVVALREFIKRREDGKAAVAAAYGAPGVVEKALRDGAGQLTAEEIAELDGL